MTPQQITATAALITAIGSLGVCEGARWEIEMRAPDERILPGFVLRLSSREISEDEPIPWEEP
jgi:hypothetical protein